jgi:hypothetical protein
MIKVNIFSSFYEEKNYRRKEELNFCLEKNIKNPNIDKIYLFVENGAKYIKKTEKEIIININKRVTYKNFFEVINKLTGEDDINIIVNSDIFFKSNDINLIKNNLTHEKCFALCRYEYLNESTDTFYNKIDSQDSWCFKGHIKFNNMECDFNLGMLGCDNRIAHEISNSGYIITNPSKDIKSYHVHNSRVRYYERIDEQIIQPPYLRLEPVTLTHKQFTFK